MKRVATFVFLGPLLAWLTAVIVAEALNIRDWFGQGGWMAGLFGIVPAAVCSWFSGQPRRQHLA